jgi:hypothetical protein
LADVESGHWRTYLISSSDYGKTLSSPQNISNDLGSAGVMNIGHAERVIRASEYSVYVVWEDNSTPKGNVDLFFIAGKFA